MMLCYPSPCLSTALLVPTMRPTNQWQGWCVSDAWLGFRLHRPHPFLASKSGIPIHGASESYITA